MRILIADDHPLVRRGLRDVLADEFPRATFGETATGEETLRRVQSEEWDALVLDITMPERSGLEILGDVKRAQPELPVLVLSIHPEDTYALRVLKAGANGYIAKVKAPDHLVEALRKVIAGGTYVSAAVGEKLAGRVARATDKGMPHEVLTNREFEVFRLIASGKSLRAIATELSIAVQTVSTHRGHILTKMGMRTNAELMRYALEWRLVE